LCGCSLLTQTPRSVAEQPWRTVESDHFRVLTDLSPEVAVRSAVELERFRRALLRVWGPRVDPPGRTDVIILRSRGELHAFAERHYAGWYAHAPPFSVLVFGAEGYAMADAPALPQVQLHELAH